MDLADYGYYIDWNGNGLFDHAYSDVSAYVLNSSWSGGFNNGPPEHASAGACYLKLDNSTSIFSSFNTSSPLYGLILPGLKIKIAMSISGGAAVTMFVGYTQNLMPIVGDLVAVSTAELTGYGILGQWSDSGDVEVALQQNITTGAALGILLDQDGFPAGDRAIETGQSTLSKWWIKNGTSRIQCIHDLEDAELGRVREGKDGKFVFEDRAHVFTAARSLNVQSTYGTGLLRPYGLRQQDPLPGIFNKIQSYVRTFNKSEDVVLVTLIDVQNKQGATPLIIPAGSGSPVIPGTLSVWFNFPTAASPNEYVGVDTWGMVDYEANTAADRTGTDITEGVYAVKTAYGPRLKIDFSNHNLTEAYLVVLRAHGNAIVEGDAQPIKSEDETSEARYRKRSFPYPSQWITDLVEGQAQLDYLISIYKNPRPRLIFEVRGNYDAAHLAEVQTRDVSDRIHITAAADFGLYINADFIIDKLSHQVDEGRLHSMTVECTVAPALQLAASGTVYAAKTIPAAPPDQLWFTGWLSAARIGFSAQALKRNADINKAEIRIKLVPSGQNLDYVDLRTVDEGGTFADNGTTQFIITKAANWRGVNHQLFYGANTGRWYCAIRFQNPAGWSVWTDSNIVPQYVKDFVDTDGDSFSDSGPPGGQTINIQQGAQAGTAVIVSSRPPTNGKRILFGFFQLLNTVDASPPTATWLNIDANTGPAITYYDGSAIDHIFDPETNSISKASGDYGDAATYGGLLLMDVRKAQFDQNYTLWAAVAPDQFVGNKILHAGFGPAFAPETDGTYTQIRIKVVKPPWAWDTVGYFGQAGYQGIGYYDHPKGGDLDSPTFKSNPFIIPAGVNFTDLQARVWFGTDYSFSDGGIHSACPSAPPAVPQDSGVIIVLSATNVTIDCGLGSVFDLVLTENVALQNFTNMKHGRPVMLIVRQDSSGGHTLTLSGSKFTCGAEITSELIVISSAAYSRSYIGFIYNADRDVIDVVAFVSTYL